MSVSGLRKIRFNAHYTLRQISRKKLVPKQTRIPIVHVDNFSLLSLRFSVPWLIVLSVWESAVYARYVLTPTHPVEFPEKNQFPNKPGFPLSALIIVVWYRSVSLFPNLLCYRFECQRFTQNTFQRLYTPSNFHKKSIPKQTRIHVVQGNNFRLLSQRFSVSWLVVLSVWESAIYAKYVLTHTHSVEFPQLKTQFPNKPGFPLSALIILDCSNVNLNRNWKNKNHDQ